MLSLAGLGSYLVVVLVIAAGVVVALDRWRVASFLAALLSRLPKFLASGVGGWGASRQALRLDGLALALVAATAAMLPIRIGALTVILFLAFLAVSLWTIAHNQWSNRPEQGHFRMFRARVRGWELVAWFSVWAVGAALFLLQYRAFHYLG